MRISKLNKYKIQFNNMRDILLASQDEFFIFTNSRNGSITITREELISFVQCVTDDVNAKYYYARKGLPIYWFVSKNGNILSLSRGKLKYVAPSTCGFEVRGVREQYEISDSKGGKPGKYNGILIDPATVVGLCFGAESTPEAKRMLDRYGLLATKRVMGKKAVETHHKEGYNKDYPAAEMRSYNCKLERIMFVTSEEHKIITHAWKTEDQESVFSQMKTLASIEPSSITAYSSITGGKGDVSDKLSLKQVCTALQSADLCLLRFGAPFLLYENGEEIIPGSDMPQELYEDYWETYKEYLEKTNNFSEPYFIGTYLEKRIFGALKSA